MCLGDGVPSRDAVYFDPEVKCCTFVPTLPNFVVGAILSDERPELAFGRRTIEERIARRVGVTPRSLAPSVLQQVVYREAVVEGDGDVFGRARSLRCPHYATETNDCGIWPHREAVCATWFCKHVRGRVGHRFWSTARRLLQSVERDLACWSLLQLGMEPEVLVRSYPPEDERPSSDDVESRVDDDTWRLRWGRWHTKEHELYRSCTQLVMTLSFAEILRIAGPQSAMLAALTRDAYRMLLVTTVPARLRPGKLRVLPTGPETLRVETYSSHDPLDLRREIVAALGSFDGRATADVLAEAATSRSALDEATVRVLVDFGLLEPLD